MICGNLSAHKAPVVQKRLLARPRVRLRFTPACSSWASQAERWFAGLQRRCPGRGVFCSLDDLTTALEERTGPWDATARPSCRRRGLARAAVSVPRQCRFSGLASLQERGS